MPVVVFMILSLFSLPAMADHHAGDTCQKPASAGPVPDGAEATRDEMLDAKDAIEQFVGRGETYLECMSGKIESVRAEIREEMAAAEAASEELEKSEAQSQAEQEYRQLVKAHDEVVAEMQRLADAFNQALQDYNEG